MSFFDGSRPLVFAHRGGAALGPENTLEAFDRGLAAGADGLELDVHLSADGRVVVHHDDTLDRTTDGSGPVAARTAAELRRLDAGCRFVATGAAGAAVPSSQAGPTETPLRGVPTLLEVLQRYPGIPIIIEMKVDTAAMGHAVAADIRAAGALPHVCAAGFGGVSLQAVRAALPGLATSASHAEVRRALYRSWVHWPARHVAYGGFQVPEHARALRVVSRTFIRHAHASGVKVQVWTVDAETDMRRLLTWGVDALITNRPDLAVRVRDAFVASRTAAATGSDA